MKHIPLDYIVKWCSWSLEWTLRTVNNILFRHFYDEWIVWRGQATLIMIMWRRNAKWFSTRSHCNKLIDNRKTRTDRILACHTSNVPFFYPRADILKTHLSNCLSVRHVSLTHLQWWLCAPWCNLCHSQRSWQFIFCFLVLPCCCCWNSRATCENMSSTYESIAVILFILNV